MRRYTFVVRVHPDATSTVENLATGERAAVGDLAAVGRQIEAWLRVLATPADPAAPRS